MKARYDAATGIATYFDPALGDRLRQEWLDEHLVPPFTSLKAADPTVSHAKIWIRRGWSWTKPTAVPDAIALLAVFGAENARDAPLPGDQQRVDWTRSESWMGEELVPLFGLFLHDDKDGRGDSEATPLGHWSPGVTSWLVAPARPWLDGIRPITYDGERLYPPEEGDQRRSEWLRDVALPAAVKGFTAQPLFRSAVLTMAQYWNDEGHDQVHLQMWWSELPTPDLSVEDSWWGLESDPVNRPNTPARRAHFNSWSPEIELFACCCREGGSQDDDPWEIEVPYAIFRRSDSSPDDVSVEVTGEVLRPWLDGLRVDQ